MHISHNGRDFSMFSIQLILKNNILKKLLFYQTVRKRRKAFFKFNFLNRNMSCQSKLTFSKCYFVMVSFVHGFKLTTLGLTMVPCITSWTITSVACSVARHGRYTFSNIQTRIRRCQAAVKNRNVSSTCLLTTNLEKRMNELVYFKMLK